MNSIEFKKILDVFDIHSITGSTKSVDGNLKSVYSWKGVDLAFGGTYYALVSGRVPYEVARIMSKKYPDYRDDVRIDGTYGYGCVGEKKFYPKDEMGNTYIDYYHVDSIEGLVYLLSEIKYFYEVRTYTEKSRKAFYREQKELLASVYRALIGEGNPSYTTEEWKMDHHICEPLESDEIRELVNQFDVTVNPYINAEVEVKDPSEFVDKAKMTVYYDRFNIMNMSIFVDGGKVEYRRDVDSNNEDEFLQYILFYDVNPDYIMSIDHTITSDYDEIRLYGFRRNYSNEGKIDLRYDMNTGIVHSTYGDDHHPMTEEEREFFISELNSALKVGQKIILGRMTKKNNNLAKKLK
ncbi:MAG: hypothetical protein K2G03_06415 [Bacilli bacterium]|nr:hypothetical protein [Bacilli bacterium]